MAASQNYFELFNLPISFDVDIASLKEKYQDLQKVVHPDRFTSASDKERLLSVQQAASINDAFDTLKKPIARAR
jgi:molecular chaperone HscB